MSKAKKEVVDGLTTELRRWCLERAIMADGSRDQTVITDMAKRFEAYLKTGK